MELGEDSEGGSELADCTMEKVKVDIEGKYEEESKFRLRGIFIVLEENKEIKAVQSKPSCESLQIGY